MICFLERKFLKDRIKKYLDGTNICVSDKQIDDSAAHYEMLTKDYRGKINNGRVILTNHFIERLKERFNLVLPNPKDFIQIINSHKTEFFVMFHMKRLNDIKIVSLDLNMQILTSECNGELIFKSVYSVKDKEPIPNLFPFFSYHIMKDKREKKFSLLNNHIKELNYKLRKSQKKAWQFVLGETPVTKTTNLIKAIMEFKFSLNHNPDITYNKLKDLRYAIFRDVHHVEGDFINQALEDVSFSDIKEYFLQNPTETFNFDNKTFYFNHDRTILCEVIGEALYVHTGAFSYIIRNKNDFKRFIISHCAVDRSECDLSELKETIINQFQLVL